MVGNNNGCLAQGLTSLRKAQIDGERMQDCYQIHPAGLCGDRPQLRMPGSASRPPPRSAGRAGRGVVQRACGGDRRAASIPRLWRRCPGCLLCKPCCKACKYFGQLGPGNYDTISLAAASRGTRIVVHLRSDMLSRTSAGPAMREAEYFVLRAFVAVQEQGSFHRAAEQLRLRTSIRT